MSYIPPRGVFDEMVGEDGHTRPHWTAFVEALGELPPTELRARWERGQLLIRDNGVTYNVYGDPAGSSRPWRLDPLPLLVDEEEWSGVEAALAQRAVLLNAILADLYGPQRLLHEAHLPPALIFGNPGFLRPLHGLAHGPGIHLCLYAADLARSPDGRWWVVGDRTEAPSGAGYALENRLIVSRVLPDLYRARPVAPLSAFFTRMRDGLLAMARGHQDNPRVVLLTPGPYNETYFEHAYLARHLGFTLTEAEDLTVRDGHVFLKTLDGLKPVDVILRRTDSAFCDPIELRADSSLGIPGLVQAVHAGTVTLANALGSQIVEAPAFAAFLPGLCRRLLGEDLAMPSVATWWCGQPKELDYVVANLHRLRIRSAHRVGGERIEGPLLSKSQREAVVARLRAKPHDYIGQESVLLSTAPVWTQDGTEARTVVLRAHVATHPGGYVVMPGGLVRVGAAAGDQVVTMQSGGGSKDCWIVGAEPPAESRAQAVEGHGVLLRGGQDLPSRVADNMFWLGRYLERAEDSARLLRGCVSRSLEAGSDEESGVRVLLDIFAALGQCPETLTKRGDAARSGNGVIGELLGLHRDDGNGAGLFGILAALRRVAGVVRDRLSTDTWRAVAGLGQNGRRSGGWGPGDLDSALAQLNDLILSLQAVAGLVRENMTRGHAWRFMDLGRRLERAFHGLDLISAIERAGEAERAVALEVALDASDSAMTYRARYLSSPRPLQGIDLLLCDESNPRSVAFQLARLQGHVDALAPSRDHGSFTAEQRAVIALLGSVRTLELRALLEGADGTLGDFVAWLRQGLGGLSDIMTRQYFVHVVETRTTILPAPEAAP